MSEAETATLIDMTAEIVAAYVAKNHVRAAELPELISTVHTSLANMGQPEIVATAEPLVPAVSVKKSITDDYLVCLDDGRKFKSLKRHLSILGMTPEQYRPKWSLARDYPMVAPGYAKARSEIAKSIGLGSIRRKG